VSTQPRLTLTPTPTLTLTLTLTPGGYFRGIDAVNAALRSSSVSFKVTAEKTPFGTLFTDSGGGAAATATAATMPEIDNSVAESGNTADGDTANPSPQPTSGSPVGPWGSHYTLMDHVIEEIAYTACEETDEGVHAQLLKILLTVTTSTYCDVHGRSLLLAVRYVYLALMKVEILFVL